MQNETLGKPGQECALHLHHVLAWEQHTGSQAGTAQEPDAGPAVLPQSKAAH